MVFLGIKFLNISYIISKFIFFSWWWTNGLGCKPEYFSANETTDTFWGEVPPNAGYRPVRPSKVTGCLLNFEYIEVIHAGIQLILVVFALCFGIPLTHYLLTVVEPKYRQACKKKPLANGHAMYSIEYNQVHENTGNNTQETDFYR